MPVMGRRWYPDSVSRVRAAVLSAINEPLTVEEVDIGRPFADEVLIDVATVGLCHSDLKFIEGAFAQPLPTVLGHEAAGIVTAVGTGVTRLQPGDHVLTALSVHCGECRFCVDGRPHLCSGKEATRRPVGEAPRLSWRGQPVSQGFDLSSFAEQMLVHESAVVAIEPDIPFAVAALLGCGVSTGLGAVLNTAGVEPGQSVAVIGCGGVGLSAIQASRIVGAAPIIAIDRDQASLELARALGATHTVGPGDGDAVAAVRRIAQGSGVDHAIEAVGSVATAEQAFAMTCRGGTATVVGLIPSGQAVSIPSDQLFYERRLQGSVMGSNDFLRDTPRYLQMYRDGALAVDDMVSNRIALDDVNEGFDRMRAGVAGRTVIEFDA
jgi:S-(hydroxymethyl)glutathione dehydrogenase/alcohol dehydrogenase